MLVLAIYLMDVNGLLFLWLFSINLPFLSFLVNFIVNRGSLLLSYNPCICLVAASRLVSGFVFIESF
jgi:hypothetical protein